MLAPSPTSLQSAIFLPLVKYIPIRSTLMSFSLPCQCAVDVYCIYACFLMYMCTCLRCGSRLASALLRGGFEGVFRIACVSASHTYHFLYPLLCHFPFIIALSLFSFSFLSFDFPSPPVATLTIFFISPVSSLSDHRVRIRDKNY